MERLFSGTDKVILDSSGQGGSGVIPYLPLPELRNRPPAQAPQSTTGGGNR